MIKLANKYWFTLGIVPLILFFLWIILVFFYNPYEVFSVFRYGQSNVDYVSGKQGELLVKQKIYGEFKAHDNYLGIVIFDFNTFNRTNLDTIVFRIKEKKSKNWYAINKYKVDRFKNGFNYPFGFPVISNSKNNTYYFEIESLYGKPGDSIGVNQNYPFIVNEYVYPRSVYFSSKEALTSFLIKKIINIFSNIVFYPILLIYAFPLVFYLLLPIVQKKEFAGKYILFFPLFILILFDKFLVGKIVDLIAFELQIFWIIVVFIYKWESSVTFFFALLFIILMPFLIILNQIEIAEKLAIQAYFFLIIGITQLAIEIKFNFKNLVTYKMFLKNIFIR